MDRPAWQDPNAFKDADVLLVHTGGSVLSWLIRVFCHGFWNHAGLLYWGTLDEANEWLVVEALEHVKITPLRKYMADSRYSLGAFRWPWPITAQQQQDIVTMPNYKAKFALHQVGDGYDVPLVLKIRWEQMLHGYNAVGGLDPLVKAEDRKWWICSLIPNMAYLSAGLHFGFGECASPQDLASTLLCVWMWGKESPANG